MIWKTAARGFSIEPGGYVVFYLTICSLILFELVIWSWKMVLPDCRFVGSVLRAIDIPVYVFCSIES